MEVTVDGKKVHLLTFKEGEFFFIHGAGCTSEVWERQLKELGGYAIDLPSHGKSDCFEIESVDDYAEVVAKVLESLGRDFIIVGHSMGGAIVQSLMEKIKPKGVVLLSTGPKLKVNPKLLAGLRDDFEKTVERLVGWMFSRSFEGKKAKERVKEMIIGCGKEVVVRDFEVCDAFDFTEKYESGVSYDFPILVAVGSDDVMTPVEYSEYLRDKTGGKLVVFNNAGHMVMFEKGSELNKVLKEFSESLG